MQRLVANSLAVQMVVAVIVAKLESAVTVAVEMDVVVIQLIVAQSDV